MKYVESFVLFESVNDEISKINRQVSFSDKWEKFHDDDINCINNYSHVLMDDYRVNIVIRENSAILYFLYKDDDGDYIYHYFDDLLKLYIYESVFNRFKNKHMCYTDFAEYLGNEQLKFFEEKNKMPTKTQLYDEVLPDLQDDYKITEISYGYFSPEKLAKNDSDPGPYFQKQYSYTDFACLIYVLGKFDNNTKNIIDNIEGRLEYYGNYSVELHIGNNYSYNGEYDFVIIIRNKKWHEI